MFNSIFKRWYIIALVLLANEVRSTIVVQLRNGTQAELPAVEIIYIGIKKYLNT